MSHGQRKPRVPRYPLTDTISRAIGNATKPAKHDIASVFHPISTAATAFREGVGTVADWSLIAGSLDVAICIEKQGVVRGLKGHLVEFEQVWQAIHDRCNRSTGWHRTPLWFHELDALRDFVRLHGYQINQLSRAEYLNAIELATSRIKSNGGTVQVVTKIETTESATA